MSITNTAKPTTTLANAEKTASFVIWDTIDTTWATEFDTWDSMTSTMNNQERDVLVDGNSTDDTGVSWSTYPPYTMSVQSFTSPGGVLQRVQFYLVKGTEIAGSVYAVIYAHSGTFGTSSVPTGARLAISEPQPITTISTILRRPLSFDFVGTNRIYLSPNTKYCIGYLCEYGSVGAHIGTYTNTDHEGNLAEWDGATWTAYSGKDLGFHLYLTSGVQNVTKPS